MREEFSTLDSRNRPRSTVRAQYAKHNPPSHAMQLVCFQIEQTHEHSAFFIHRQQQKLLFTRREVTRL